MEKIVFTIILSINKINKVIPKRLGSLWKTTRDLVAVPLKYYTLIIRRLL